MYHRGEILPSQHRGGIQASSILTETYQGTHFPEKEDSQSIARFVFRAQSLPMNRATIRRLIDASLGISHQHTKPGTSDLHNAEATHKPSSLLPETPMLATESESDPSPPTAASSDGTGVE